VDDLGLHGIARARRRRDPRRARGDEHWLVLDALRPFGVTPVERRVVEQGKVITAAGVSSGIDMALGLAAKIAGEDLAQAIQLGIEYDPQPPYDSGSTPTARPEIVELVRSRATLLA
jgi:hypothetical protein